ncbi:efflux RND transporter periplasmic adaptor subunit [Eionea flava]
MQRQQGSAKTIIILLLGLLIAAALYWFRPQPALRPPVAETLPVVSVLSVKPQSRTLYVGTQGTVTPRRAIALVAEVSGRVIEMDTRFADGGRFVDGETLMTLDDRDYQYQLIEAESQLAIATRELALEKGQARQAKREWRDLGNKEANALSLRQPQVNAAQAQLAAAKAQQNIVRLNIQRTRIQAPFSGRVQQRYVDIGQYVTAGTTVADIYDSSSADVRLPLSDRQMAFLGQPVGELFTIDQSPPVVLSAEVGGQRRQWQGRLVSIDATVDETTRFYSAVARIEQPFDRQRHDYPLPMGLFVEAMIEGRVVDDVAVLPEKALIDQQWVYVVNDDSRIEKRSVQRIRADGADIWVRGNISTGDQVVVSDPRVLSESMQVTVSIPASSAK